MILRVMEMMTTPDTPKKFTTKQDCAAHIIMSYLSSLLLLDKLVLLLNILEE